MVQNGEVMAVVPLPGSQGVPYCTPYGYPSFFQTVTLAEPLHFIVAVGDVIVAVFVWLRASDIENDVIVVPFSVIVLEPETTAVPDPPPLIVPLKPRVKSS